jgi:hypothetical protein
LALFEQKKISLDNVDSIDIVAGLKNRPRLRGDFFNARNGETGETGKRNSNLSTFTGKTKKQAELKTALRMILKKTDNKEKGMAIGFFVSQNSIGVKDASAPRKRG